MTSGLGLLNVLAAIPCPITKDLEYVHIRGGCLVKNVVKVINEYSSGLYMASYHHHHHHNYRHQHGSSLATRRRRRHHRPTRHLKAIATMVAEVRWREGCLAQLLCVFCTWTQAGSPSPGGAR